ncbi:metal ABC transporter solute-binding protein, Zn/Mn family [Enterococcus olivae]
MKKLLVAGAVLLSSLLLAACGNTTTEEEASLEVVATFYPMYEFTKAVIGDEGEVSLLIPAGTEMHDYEPSAKDVAQIAESDAFVYNSQELESWVERLGDNVDPEQTLFIEAASEISLMEAGSQEADDHDHDHDHEEEHHHSHDPHVWVDPVMAMTEVETIRDQLSEKYPEKKAIFEANSDAYLAELAALDQEFRSAFQEADNKTFVTQHAAFAYLAKQYGLIQESIAGISSEEEPTPSRLAELKHFVEEHQVEVIYFEENASSKVAETLAKETGVILEVLNPLESLTDEQIEAGETYVSVMRENLQALQLSIQ